VLPHPAAIILRHVPVSRLPWRSPWLTLLDVRFQLLAERNVAWQSFWNLLDAPVDDEPHTWEERTEDDAALERAAAPAGPRAG
jgi:hypothetical protein